MNDLTYVSTFSGIEGIGLGLERAGFRCLAQVEINPFCRRVLDKRFPDVPKFGDIGGFGADSLRDRGGWSEDERGQGGWAGGEVGWDDVHARPREQARSDDRPTLLCGGFPCQDLSVAGKRAGLAGARSGLFYQFVRVARELRPRWLLVENVPGLLSSNEGRDFAVVLGELGDAGYFVEWRVLDSRWFGVAQRRRRVFLVGHLGGPPPSPVLFESEGSGWDLEAGDEAGEEIAGTLGGGAPGARGWRGDLDGSGAYIPEIGRALTGTMGKRHDPDTDTYVAHTLRASGFDASEDGTGRGTPLVVDSVALRGRDGGATAELGGDLAHAVRSSQGGGDKGHVFIAAPLTSGGHPNSHAPGRRKEDDENLVSFYSHTGQDQTFYRNESPPVMSSYPPSVKWSASSVRRLTPTECERLQGFPDGWTCLCDKTPCTCPDGPRYAALGNAVTVNVAEWIARRIAAVSEEQ